MSGIDDPAFAKTAKDGAPPRECSLTVKGDVESLLHPFRRDVSYDAQVAEYYYPAGRRGR